MAATATIAAGVPRAFAGTPAHRTYGPVLDPADFVRVIEGQVMVTAHSGGGVLRRCRRHAACDMSVHWGRGWCMAMVYAVV